MSNMRDAPITYDPNDQIAHYGRLGMKWYQHIFGDYQGIAKYAEKGVRKAKSLESKGKTEKAKEVRSKAMSYKRSLAEEKKKQRVAEIKEEKERLQKLEKERIKNEKANAKIESDRESKEAKAAKKFELDVLDVMNGKLKGRDTSPAVMTEAILRLEKEKKIKDLQGELSGVKPVKDVIMSILTNKETVGQVGKLINGNFETNKQMRKDKKDAAEKAENAKQEKLRVKERKELNDKLDQIKSGRLSLNSLTPDEASALSSNYKDLKDFNKSYEALYGIKWTDLQGPKVKP